MKIAINFQFGFTAKTFQIVDRTTPEGGGGAHALRKFLSPAPSSHVCFPAYGVWEGSQSFALSLTVTSRSFTTFGNVSSLFVAEVCPLRRGARLSTLAKEKNLRLHIRASNVTTLRLPRAFQAPYCKIWIGHDWIGLGFVTHGFSKHVLENKIHR